MNRNQGFSINAKEVRGEVIDVMQGDSEGTSVITLANGEAYES